jgi:hypothetical protein
VKELLLVVTAFGSPSLWLTIDHSECVNRLNEFHRSSISHNQVCDSYTKWIVSICMLHTVPYSSVSQVIRLECLEFRQIVIIHICYLRWIWHWWLLEGFASRLSLFWSIEEGRIETEAFNLSLHANSFQVSAIRNCNSLFERGILQMVFNCSHSVCRFSTNSTEVYIQKALTKHMAIQGHQCLLMLHLCHTYLLLMSVPIPLCVEYQTQCLIA